jgi:hypothetical protein
MFLFLQGGQEGGDGKSRWRLMSNVVAYDAWLKKSVRAHNAGG